MILNLSTKTATWLLTAIDLQAPVLLAAIKKARGQDKHELVLMLKHLGIVKHRLEAALMVPDPFIGPIEWGYQLEPDDR